jgi:hypothetical protein
LVAADPWDLRAASNLGLATAYIARPDAEAPASTDSFEAYAGDLSELSDICGDRAAGPLGGTTEQ